jgi:hypothetical protein
MNRFVLASVIMLSIAPALAQQPRPARPAPLPPSAPQDRAEDTAVPKEPGANSPATRQPRPGTITSPVSTSQDKAAEDIANQKREDAKSTAMKEQGQKVRDADALRMEARDRKLQRSMRAICPGC